ncbi:class I SAM-dependent methyltransferase [Ligilactobacillus murinus]|uniref:Class I SAM-dependent methyltransferase n=1 Tax=Ligilactobacillus murinus TaxID=1622 RepID=A0AAE6WGU9_9LACO|nr:class I SAM-dependent methyltransferase [Ligilactobacillus murinus]NEF81900.1 class I SAM-dependent methyltransferase [Ligilactobacillus murinus]NEF84028.1 class I SAM-dependent methyltransferase [Ligilactobacillus murinus]NEF86387.1 class I SAM-dependent methyltransferase [Ligilactobacillus murinus]NEF88738.1 class I SAM-dependent methyltransferase [Ligilactobacillus murinus]NEF91007.1 class I SAM-dependent methyltransferase [Ligilactobacillus murinus]
MKILDVCCGSRMFWYDKQESHTTYMDIRRYHEELPTGHVINVDPDIQADFRSIPFADETFDLVVFDPPHLIHAGPNSWLAKKYGTLDKNHWPDDLKRGFDECNRVLKPNSTLIFKWNEDQIKFRDVIKVFGRKPIFGDRRSKTRWSVFLKG